MTTAKLPRLDVRVHAIQGDFVADDHHYAMLLGGIGSGKTTAGAIKALRHVTPGSLGLVIAPMRPGGRRWRSGARSGWPSRSCAATSCASGSPTGPRRCSDPPKIPSD
jgi:hypothetical protein